MNRAAFALSGSGLDWIASRADGASARSGSGFFAGLPIEGLIGCWHQEQRKYAESSVGRDRLFVPLRGPARSSPAHPRIEPPQVADRSYSRWAPRPALPRQVGRVTRG